jgi:hypothetical protein
MRERSWAAHTQILGSKDTTENTREIGDFTGLLRHHQWQTGSAAECLMLEAQPQSRRASRFGLFLLRARGLCRLFEKLGVELRIQFDLLEFRRGRCLTILLIFVLVRHGEAVGSTPVGEIGLAFE